MKKLLLTRSRHDSSNQYLYAYSAYLIKEAENAGWKISKAEDERNNSQEVQSRLKTNPDFVIFNGHGEDDAVYGHNDELLISSTAAHLLKNTIVFARSCSAAKVLGEKACNEGCKAFIGYDGLLVIPQVYEYESRPLSDPSAKPVLEVSNIVPTFILKGATVQTTVTASRKKAAELMRKMLFSEEPYDKAAFKALFDNNLNLAYKGDPQTCVK